MITIKIYIPLMFKWLSSSEGEGEGLERSRSMSLRSPWSLELATVNNNLYKILSTENVIALTTFHRSFTLNSIYFKSNFVQTIS